MNNQEWMLSEPVVDTLPDKISALVFYMKTIVSQSMISYKEWLLQSNKGETTSDRTRTSNLLVLLVFSATNSFRICFQDNGRIKRPPPGRKNESKKRVEPKKSSKEWMSRLKQKKRVNDRLAGWEEHEQNEIME